ncbi:MAG: hypothetical protein PHV23_03150 [Candidatus Gracilibacteria bacterium]|nr:hypothetical protein [Candidatus Gracilibacteria bacterium]
MNRKIKNIKNTIISAIKNLKFKYINLPIKNQLVIFSSLLGIISLFIPWIIDIDNNIKWNAFNTLTGNIGYILIIIFIVPLLLIVSSSYREKIKLYTDINFKNHYIIINSGLISISISIISLSFAIGLSTLGQNIVYGNGPILSMTAGILVLISGFLVRKDYKKTSSEIILEQLNQNREKIKEKNNMELPF